MYRANHLPCKSLLGTKIEPTSIAANEMGKMTSPFSLPSIPKCHQFQHFLRPGISPLARFNTDETSSIT